LAAYSYVSITSINNLYINTNVFLLTIRLFLGRSIQSGSARSHTLSLCWVTAGLSAVCADFHCRSRGWTAARNRSSATARQRLQNTRRNTDNYE